MFVAFCDHVAGNSTFSCLNEPTAAVRGSQSTVSKGCTPACVNRRRTVRASPERGSLVSVVCGVCSMEKLPSLLWPAGRSAKFDGPTSFEVPSDGLGTPGRKDRESAGNRPHILPLARC